MSVQGIDVSAYQGKPDWAKVASDGVVVAILRIANSKGTDSSFEHNYEGCGNNGIKRGVYRYSYAKTTAAAKEEAEEVVSILNGRDLEAGVWLDLEWSTQRALGTDAITSIAKAFINVIEEAGYKCGIYCNRDWYLNVLDTEALDVSYWIARYPSSDNGSIKESLRPNLGEVAWQYSSKGSISGISGNVDMDDVYDTFELKSIGSGSTTVETKELTLNSDALSSLQEALNADGVTDSNGKELVVDGKNGPKTESAIAKVLMKSGAFNTSTAKYKVGSTGQVVKWLQMRLDSLIGDVIQSNLGTTLTAGGEPDGKYGTQCRQAVILFQRIRGLDDDGIAGPKTVTQLLYE